MNRSGVSPDIASDPSPSSVIKLSGFSMIKKNDTFKYAVEIPGITES